MKKIIGSKCANLYINAAIKLGLNFRILSKKILLYKIYDENKEIIFKNGAMDLNNQVGVRIAQNKNEASILFKSKKIPVPNFIVFNKEQDAIEYLKQKKESIVIKPTNDMCAHGVTICPKNMNQKQKAVKEAFYGHKKIMVEDFIKGENYRITIFQKTLIAITQRKSAYIIGNGINNIKELIVKKNQKRLEKKYDPIILRNKDIDYLNSKNVSLDFVPRKNQSIKLQLGCDMDIGGERENIDINSIPKENIELFKKIAKLSQLDLIGIDFIIPEIKKSYRKQACGLNEVNSAPDMIVHYLDQNPPSNYAAEKILETYFFDQPVITDKLIQTQGQFLQID